MKRLLQQKGETLAETLASTLIITMLLTMVAGAVLTAARVNNKADNAVNTLKVEGVGVQTVSGISFTLQSESGSGGGTGTSNTSDYSVPLDGAAGHGKVYHDHQEGKHDYYFFE